MEEFLPSESSELPIRPVVISGFVDHVTTLYQMRVSVGRNIDRLEMKTHFNVLPRLKVRFSQSIQSPDQDSALQPAEYESGVLTTAT
jgi:hypothetical protein